MSSGQHFLIGFLLAVAVAVLLAFGVYVFQDHLTGLSVAPSIIMLGAFIGGYLGARSLWGALMSIKCPYCGNKSYTIKGRPDRFRCYSCGQDS
jgi:hypothetical protein